MQAYEVQPKGHTADFKIRRRNVERAWLVCQANERGQPCVIVKVSFCDGYTDGWELEFRTTEWAEFVNAV